jgi:hypothetical protein
MTSPSLLDPYTINLNSKYAQTALPRPRLLPPHPFLMRPHPFHFHFLFALIFLLES